MTKISNSSVGTVTLDLGLNYADFKQQLNSIAGTTGGMLTNAFVALGAVIAGAFAINKLMDFGKAAIDLASDLTEVQNVVDVTFGNASSEIDAFADSSLKAFGLSEYSAKKYASTMGAMLKSSGVSNQSMIEMSKTLTGLSADMASFYNLKTDQAFDN